MQAFEAYWAKNLTSFDEGVGVLHRFGDKSLLSLHGYLKQHVLFTSYLKVLLKITIFLFYNLLNFINNFFFKNFCGHDS